MSQTLTPPRIVDAVFARGPRPPRQTVALALIAGLAIHAGVVGWGIASAPSLELWSAELATRVHAELTHEQVVELPPPPPPHNNTPMPPAPEPPAPHPTSHARRMPTARAAPPPPPAQAGRILAANLLAAVDLPNTTFVTGTASSYAGGVTASMGTNTNAVHGPVSTGPPPPAPTRRAPPPPAEDHSSPVVLDVTDWSCSWPREADAQQVDEQSVILQVLVRSDGSAESVRTLSDPGYGFANAARACALATHFTPAHDREGTAIRAESPPIRVHFTR